MRVLIFLAILLTPFPAKATQMTVEQIIFVATALTQLDVYERVIKDGTAEKVIKEPYKFGGTVRLILASNLAKARNIVASYQSARASILRELDSLPVDERTIRIQVEDRKILDSKADVDFVKIKSSDLRLDENPIPPSVLSMIIPILE